MAIQQKRMTYSEFESFTAAPENRERKFELIDGEIVEVSPTELLATLAATIAGEIYAYLKQHPGGRVSVEPRHKMPDDEHNALLPDVAYTRAEGLQPVTKRGPVPRMPDLAVEVKSPDDSLIELRQKAAYYLTNGARMVWLLIPEKSLVEVYRPKVDVEILNENDSINGGDLLPGFSLSVRDVFDV